MTSIQTWNDGICDRMATQIRERAFTITADDVSIFLDSVEEAGGNVDGARKLLTRGMHPYAVFHGVCTKYNLDQSRWTNAVRDKSVVYYTGEDGVERTMII